MHGLFTVLQIPPQVLLTLNGFEQGFKISFAEAFGTFSLDDFNHPIELKRSPWHPPYIGYR